ncbi:MAG: RNA polymerase sigma factor [Oscillospiraceae bacterium]|jgi:RNA polymerase sigma-70 factor (ECF subfamily)|nr:RNA polymerase sigma factor [Oscillospiraceae bacterium]
MVNKVEELYNTYFHDVYLYLISIVRNESIAEELTQETFFKAMKSLESFRGDCSVRSWLCQIAKNLYISQCRKNSKISDNAELEIIPESDDPLEERIADKEMAVKIHRILHTTKEPYKEVFSLRIFGELSFGQIADIFGKTESWARVTFYRAKVMITEQLEELS